MINQIWKDENKATKIHATGKMIASSSNRSQKPGCRTISSPPIIAAEIEIVHQGKLSNPYSVFLSLAHNYHGVSLIRRMFQIAPQPMRLHGERFITPVICTDSRSGPVTDGSTTDQIRSHINVTFQSGKSACYDFADVQYRSFIRSRHVNVQGQKGEWNDCFLRSMKYAGKDNWSPSLSMPQVDDEYALATMLYDYERIP